MKHLTFARGAGCITVLWLVVNGLVYFGLPPIVTDDGIYYFNVGTQIATGAKSPEPFYQPAGYVVLVGWFAHWSSIKLLIGLQHLLVLGSGLAALYCGMLLACPWAGLLTGCYLVGNYYTAAISQNLLCETVSLFLVSTGLVLLVKAAVRDTPHRLLWISGAGLAWGLLGTMRPVAFAVAALLAGLIAVAFDWRRPAAIFGRRRGFPSGVPRLTLAFVIPVFVCYVAACAVSMQSTGFFELTHSRGRHMFNRVFAVDMVENTEGTYTCRLLQIVGKDSMTCLNWWDVYPACLKAGLSPREADDLLWRSSLESFQTTDTRFVGAKYLLGTIVNTASLYLHPRSILRREKSPKLDENHGCASQMAFVGGRSRLMFEPLLDVVRAFNPVWLFHLLGLTSVCGLGVLTRRSGAVVVVCLAAPMLSYLFLSAAVEIVETRHVMPWLLPRTLLGMLGLQWCLLKLCEFWRAAVPPERSQADSEQAQYASQSV